MGKPSGHRGSVPAEDQVSEANRHWRGLPLSVVLSDLILPITLNCSCLDPRPALFPSVFNYPSDAVVPPVSVFLILGFSTSECAQGFI